MNTYLIVSVDSKKQIKSIEETPFYSISFGKKNILVMIVITLILFRIFHLLIPNEELREF